MKKIKIYISIFLSILMLASNQMATAGSLRDRMKGHQTPLPASDELEEIDAVSAATVPSKVRSWRDIPYGKAPRQKFDVYAPREAKAATVIFMVHGGAWRLGDKSAGSVVDKKVDRWVTRGFVFISINYRLLPDADPLAQAEDVARALAAAQARAKDWGADPSRFILMGHSAGAHLVAWLSADPSRAFALGAKPWLGTVLLDSAALNVVQVMEARHARLYDRAFGGQPESWEKVSPFHALSSAAVPMLAVCSSLRRDACPQARAFAARAVTLGVRAEVLEQGLSHGEVNSQLGADGVYTDAVEAFIGSLDKPDR